jgi:hypothetical protein
MQCIIYDQCHYRYDIYNASYMIYHEYKLKNIFENVLSYIRSIYSGIWLTERKGMHAEKTRDFFLPGAIVCTAPYFLSQSACSL